MNSIQRDLQAMEAGDDGAAIQGTFEPSQCGIATNQNQVPKR